MPSKNEAALWCLQRVYSRWLHRTTGCTCIDAGWGALAPVGTLDQPYRITSTARAPGRRERAFCTPSQLLREGHGPAHAGA